MQSHKAASLHGARQDLGASTSLRPLPATTGLGRRSIYRDITRMATLVCVVTNQCSAISEWSSGAQRSVCFVTRFE